jgi:hypothetical protein
MATTAGLPESVRATTSPPTPSLGLAAATFSADAAPINIESARSPATTSAIHGVRRGVALSSNASLRS